MLLLKLLLVLPTPPVSTLLWIFVPISRTHFNHSPICHSSAPIHFSLLHPLLLLTPTVIGASVHLDAAPTHQLLPPINALNSLDVPNLLPRYLPDPGVLHRVPVVSVSLVRPPPLCRPRFAPRFLLSPRGSPFRGSLPSLPSNTLPTCRHKLAAHYLPVPRGLRQVICVPLALVHPPCPPCCRAVYWCIMVSGVFVGRNFSPERDTRASQLPDDRFTMPFHPR